MYLAPEDKRDKFQYIIIQEDPSISREHATVTVSLSAQPVPINIMNFY